MKQPCSLLDCGYPIHAHDLCEAHYRRFKKYGNPLMGGYMYRPKPPFTDIPDGYKWCSRCCQVKSLDGEFGFDKGTQDGRAYWCKRCYTDSRLTKTYNITLEQYEAMLAAQNGGCYLCGIELDPYARVSRLSVDHDHACCPTERSCGKCIRGLLCTQCNHTLGSARDDVALLARMIEYLNYHHERLELSCDRSCIQVAHSG